MNAQYVCAGGRSGREGAGGVGGAVGRHCGGGGDGGGVRVNVTSTKTNRKPTAPHGRIVLHGVGFNAAKTGDFRRGGTCNSFRSLAVRKAKTSNGTRRFVFLVRSKNLATDRPPFVIIFEEGWHQERGRWTVGVTSCVWRRSLHPIGVKVLKGDSPPPLPRGRWPRGKDGLSGPHAKTACGMGRGKEMGATFPWEGGNIFPAPVVGVS